MKIGLLIDTYKPVTNGVTNFVSLHKRALAAAGHEPWVITFGHTQYRDDEPNVVRSRGLPLGATGYYASVGYSQATRRVLSALDIFHVHHPFLSGTLAVRLSERYGIPMVFTNHTRYDLYTTEHLRQLPPGPVDTVLSSFFEWFTRRCQVVIAPSAGIRSVLEKWHVQCPVEVIPNGIELAPFANPPWQSTRDAEGIPSNAVVAIFIGRMAPEKNVEFLLRAFAAAQQEVSPAFLLIVGGGPELRRYQALAETLGIASRVRFTGAMPYTRIPGYLALADFFVTASVTEVHPLTVLEAMAARRPVLGIASPGISDTIVDDVNGFTVANNLPALAGNLVRLFRDAALRTRLAEGAAHTSRQYDIQQTLQRHLALYEQVLRYPIAAP